MLDEEIRIHYGKFRGERITRIPISYLRWMVNEKADLWTEAKAELQRRGTVTHKLDVSHHALDRASIKYLDKFMMDTTDPDEGIHAWLHRLACEALEKKDLDAGGRYRHNGMKFAIIDDKVWPVVKTVI